MGFIEFTSGVAVGLVICLLLVSSNLSNSSQLQVGTNKENALLMEKVTELQSQGYTISYQKNIGDAYSLIENYADFVSFLQTNNLTSLHYTLYGTLGPKIFVSFNGTDYYWRAD